MWDNYRQIVKLCLPSAYICVDALCKTLHKESYVKNIVM